MSGLSESCPSAWPLKCLCSKPCPPIDGRKEKINTSLCLRLSILGDIYKINGFFILSPYLPCLWSKKEPGIQTPTRLVFWDIILPSSLSANSPNKVVSLLQHFVSDSLACHVASRASLDSLSFAALASKERHSRLMPSKLCVPSWKGEWGVL